MRINLSKWSGKSSDSKWLAALMKRFAEEYDIKFGAKVREYVSTPPGARAFAAYLKSEGFKVEYWCLEPLVTKQSYSDSKLTEYLGFGLIIDDTCPLLVEAKLKHS